MISFTEFIEQDFNSKSKDVLIEESSAFAERNYPIIMERIRRYDKLVLAELEPKKAKDFYLSKQKSKKLGFVYIVRYRDSKGNILPSHWSTKTNIRDKAEKFAIENRETLLKDYYNHNEGDSLYQFLADYYLPGNEAFNCDVLRGDRKPIIEKIKKHYYNFITKVFIPFMKEEQKKRSLKEITTLDITLFQNHLLEGKKPLKGQTINNMMAGLKPVFAHLLKYGKISNNPFSVKLALKRESESTGVYELPKLKGFFSDWWEDKLSYILNLIIYFCGLRNEETNSLKVSDITNTFDGITFDNYFLRVCESITGKTENAKRVIPLHPFVHQKLMEYIQENKKENDFIFDDDLGKDFSKANILLGAKLGYSEQQLEKENIRYYSGRHFWKTAMYSGGLGEDVEELFMGHRVSQDVKRIYTHKNKIGQENLNKKIKLMFEIIDTTFFEK
jgi:integrase